MDKIEIFKDAYDPNMQILNAGVKGSGLQNDAFNMGQEGAFDASKFFRAAGNANEKSNIGGYNVAGLYVVVQVAGAPPPIIPLYNVNGTVVTTIHLGDVIYNYAVRNPQNANSIRIKYSGIDYYITVNSFGYLRLTTIPIVVTNPPQITTLHSHAEGEKKSELKHEKMHQKLRADGAPAVNKSAVSAAYKSLVDNVNQLKSTTNGKDFVSALAIIEKAKIDLANIAQLLKP